VPKYLRTVASRLIGEECAVELLDNLNYKHVPCLKLGLSKGLSLGIIGGAMVVKVPQIAKIVMAGSTEGISMLAYLLETLAASITFAYNFRLGHAFSTYGETLFMTVQNMVVLALMAGYRRGRGSALLLIIGAIYAVFMAGLLAPGSGNGVRPIGEQAMRTLQTMTIPLAMASRLPQIWSSWRNKSTGQLSALTVFLIWAGCCARVYTSLQETAEDKLLISGFLLAALLNSIIFLQLIYYWKGKSTAKKMQHTPKPKKAIRSLTPIKSAKRS